MATWVPFAPAADLLARFTGGRVSAATARRRTEAAGGAYVAAQTAEAARLARDAPPPPPGPAVQPLSADGAMVPLVGGEWTEVKTLAIGTVVADAADPGAARATELSYFSRRAEAEAFVAQALVEAHRRGVATAGEVAPVVDGSVWCQGVADVHRPDAVRLLDHPHAAEHLTAAAQATFGEAGGEAGGEARAWAAQQAHALKHADPATVLAALRALPVADAVAPQAAATTRDATLAYLEARREQIHYAQFRARGLPIGSGAVESANKRVVEARLKGTGMRWAPDHINPMVALRTAVCSDRWAGAWAELTLTSEVRAQGRGRARDRRAARCPAVAAPPPPAAPPRPAPLASPAIGPPPAPATRPKTVVNGRPTAAHPWKRLPCLPGGHASRDAHPKL